MLRIEVLLTENELAEQCLAALRNRYLPEKLFYWFPLSVRAWLNLCKSAAPYRNFSRSYELIQKHAVEIARQLTGPSAKELEVVGLGAGQGDKDLLVLEALRAEGAKVSYQPVDSSQALLEIALGSAASNRFPACGLKADLADPRTAKALAASAGGPRLYLVVGNTLGVTGPVQFLEMLRLVLRPEDRVLVDGEIFDEQGTMAGYDNPVNRQFAFAPLASVGLEEGRDGELVFESRADAGLDGLRLVSKHFRAARSLEIRLAAERVTLSPGEKVEMSSSYKYSRDAFLSMLREAGGLDSLAEYVSDDRHFVMVFARPWGGPSWPSRSFPGGPP